MELLGGLGEESATSDARPYASEAERVTALPGFLHTYIHHRGQTRSRALRQRPSDVLAAGPMPITAASTLFASLTSLHVDCRRQSPVAQSTPSSPVGRMEWEAAAAATDFRGRRWR